jgi:Bacteriophage Mu Gp45 spike protein
MHRATPANTSFRAYSAGGARALISSVDPAKLMQEVGASFMKGESRSKIEAPSMYGFTCVPFAADKGEEGKPGLGPETFISFIGGNRSFPVAGPIDDRRHRLLGLAQGDVALFRGKDDGQQFHLTDKGGFWSGMVGKVLRMALVSGGGGGGGSGPSASLAAASSGSSSAASSGSAASHGQKPVAGQDSTKYFEIDADRTESVNKKHTIMLDDKETAVELVEVDGQKRVYLGAKHDSKHKFAPVITALGPSTNVFARID